MQLCTDFPEPKCWQRQLCVQTYVLLILDEVNEKIIGGASRRPFAKSDRASSSWEEGKIGPRDEGPGVAMRKLAAVHLAMNTPQDSDAGPMYRREKDNFVNIVAEQSSDHQQDDDEATIEASGVALLIIR